MQLVAHSDSLIYEQECHMASTIHQMAWKFRSKYSKNISQINQRLKIHNFYHFLLLINIRH